MAEFEKMKIVGDDTSIPVGCILFYAGIISTFLENNPKWLLCNGDQVSLTSYPQLDVIANLYGEADENYVRLPNLRARTLVGVDDRQQSILTLGKTMRGVMSLPQGVTPSALSGEVNYFYANQSSMLFTKGTQARGYSSRANGIFTASGPYGAGVSGTSNDAHVHARLIKADFTKIFGTVNGEGSLFSDKVDGIIPNCVVCYPIIRAKR